MKKVLSKVLSLCIAVMVAFGLIIVPAAAPAHADGFVSGSIKYRKSMTLYSGSEYGNVYLIKMGSKLKGAKSVKIKSSNKKVLEPFGYYKGDKDLMANAKKSGKADLTVKVKKGGKTKTYKIKVKVEKSGNPFKSFKVGKKNITSQFKSEQIADCRVKNNSKQKISIKPKSGMKIKKIQFSTYDFETDKSIRKNIKNNSTVKVKKDETNIYVELYEKKSKITYCYYVFM